MTDNTEAKCSECSDTEDPLTTNQYQIQLPKIYMNLIGQDILYEAIDFKAHSGEVFWTLKSIKNDISPEPIEDEHVSKIKYKPASSVRINLQPSNCIHYLKTLSVTVETEGQTALSPHQFPFYSNFRIYRLQSFHDVTIHLGFVIQKKTLWWTFAGVLLPKTKHLFHMTQCYVTHTFLSLMSCLSFLSQKQNP